MMDEDELVKSIETKRKPYHDTIYCNPSYEQSFRRAIDGPTSLSLKADNIKLLGLEVVTFPEIERPIVCKKGQVFDVAKDYKNGESSPQDL